MRMAALLVALALAGCGRRARPTDAAAPGTVTIRGRVTLAGQPLTWGIVTAHTADSRLKNRCSRSRADSSAGNGQNS